MSDAKKELALFYLDGNRGYYLAGSRPNALQLDIPQDALSDLELVSKEKLAALIKAFVETNQIQPANIFFLLSLTVTFDREFPEGLPAEIEGEMKSFLNFVPFEETYSKLIRLNKKVKVVAANKEVCESLRSAFEDLQFSTAAIVPLSAVQEVMPELANNLDLAFILARVDGIRQFNLLGPEAAPNLAAKTSAGGSTPAGHTREYALVGIFVVLLAVLGFVVYTNIIAPPAPKSHSVALPTLVPTRAQQVSPPTQNVSVTPGVISATPSIVR